MARYVRGIVCQALGITALVLVLELARRLLLCEAASAVLVSAVSCYDGSVAGRYDEYATVLPGRPPVVVLASLAELVQRERLTTPRHLASWTDRGRLLYEFEAKTAGTPATRVTLTAYWRRGSEDVGWVLR